MNKRVSNLSLLGWLLVLGGIAGVIYFGVFFDTSVSTPQITKDTLGIDRVNNIGLMQDRQTGIIVSVAIAIVGAIFLVARLVTSSRTPTSTTRTDFPSPAIAPSQEDLQILLMQRKKNPFTRLSGRDQA